MSTNILETVVSISNPVYNKVYDFNFTINAVCEDTGEDISHLVMSAFKQGSVAGRFAELVTQHQFKDHLELSDSSNSNGYDLVVKTTGAKVENKAVTHNGVKTCRSSYVGANRKIPSLDIVAEETKALTYVFSDVGEIDKGRIRLVVKEGEEVASHNYSLSRKKALSAFFGESEERDTGW